MNNNDVPPIYEVEEISLEQLILDLATEQEKYRTEYQQASARLLQMYAA